MERQQKKQIQKYISWCLLAVLVATLAILPMLATGEETAEGPQASVLSDTAALRDISAKIMGGGTLTAEKAVEITIPAAVKLTEYLVSNGDLVTQGQEIAAVDRVTVMTAITEVQATMDDLEAQINDVRSDTAPEQVTATAGGTVKILYAQSGDSVSDVMLRHGALAVLSLDGLMAVDVQRNTRLSGGDAVTVTLSDGTELTGRVESNLEGILTVTIEDGGYPVGEAVKVTTEDGDRIGSGNLYIHSQWNVVAYSGTVSRVRVSEGDTVKAGRTLFNLTDTGHSAEFETLSRLHREYEALMLELFRMYQSERITAPGTGMVTGVDESGAYMISGSGSGYHISLLANAPYGDADTEYINYIGQVREVGIDGLILKMNPQALSITDYKDLSGVPLDTALMTEEAIYTAGAPVYGLSEDQWVEIGTDSLAAGDLLLFACDSSGIVWAVRVGSAAVQPEEPEQPTEPERPTEPSPTEPSDPTAPSGSGGATKPNFSSGGSGSQGGGRMPSGGAATEKDDGLYALDTVTVASVTPQETLTVLITVDELDISKLYVGQSALLTVDALSGETFSAEVTAISGTGENEGGNSKFTVELTTRKQSDMLAGMSASISITTHTVEQAVTVPVAALVEKGTETMLYTSFDEETQEYGDPVTVTVGASDGEYVQILSGIGLGQTIYYPYYDTLVISNVPESGRFSFR